MKYITTTLLLIVGMQVSINAEIIYFEKVLQREEHQVLTHKEYNQQYNTFASDFDAKRILLGTIRLEEGEELTVNNRKWTTASCCGNEADGFTLLGGGNYQGGFIIEIDFDKFTQNEKIVSRYEGGNQWGEQRIEEGLQYDGSLWPVEGPATIKIQINPVWYIPKTDAPTINDILYKTITPEQYCRISFKKNLASYRVNQNQLQALVLPKGVEGMSVIMESSEDLVNWTRDNPGRKPTANRPKFFRLRAVKE
jgi:hypothetical protein